MPSLTQRFRCSFKMILPSLFSDPSMAEICKQDVFAGFVFRHHLPHGSHMAFDGRQAVIDAFVKMNGHCHSSYPYPPGRGLLSTSA